MKILIADDHAMVRKGLRETLLESDKNHQITEVASGPDLLACIAAEPFDLVLMDISMPGMTGLEALRQAKTIRPELPVLILTMHPEDQYAVRVIKLGAAGYLNKSSASEQLIAAVDRTCSGGKYITEAVASRLAAEVETESEPGKLSDREFEVLRNIALGKMPKEIADDLQISVKTVNSLRERVLDKMGMKSNAEIIRYAIKRGLIE